MSKNSHNALIDESPKSWNETFNQTGKNAHGQTWEDIFRTPAEPARERADEANQG